MATPKDESRRCTAKTARSGGKDRCPNAAIRGGFVCPTHGGKAPQVRKKANERLQDLIDPNRLLRTAAELALSDVREIFDTKGNLLDPGQWPDAVARAVASVEVVKRNVYSNDDEVDDVIKIKLWDKVRPLEMLFKHKGLLAEQVDVNMRVDEVTARLLAGRARVAQARKRGKHA